MKVIIAGSRSIDDPGLVAAAVEASGFTITEVVSGAAKGVDTFGEEWAAVRGVPVKRFPADWKRYGRRAGPVRNREMAEYADALVALPKGESRGTRNMIDEARKRGLQVFVYEIDG